MSLDSRYDILFEPVQVGPKVAKNRFWQAPHATGFGAEYPGAQAAYRGVKAEGGWGVVFTEATSIAPEVDKSPYVLGRMWDEGDIRNFGFVVDAIHEHGALAGVELEYHSSTSYVTEGRGLNARGLLPIAGESGLAVPYAGTAAQMDVEDIEEVQDLHVRAALRAKDAGFDLITLHCGHAASILAHFLIPYYNQRTDEYGGSRENRARFIRETLTKVRAAVGDDVAVGLRLGVDTLDAPYGLGDRGLRVATGDTPWFVEHLDDLVDYWDFVIGGFDWGQDAQSSRTAKENHEAAYTRDLKKCTAKPVVNVGRFNSPDTMVEVIKSGQCDFIGAARASISDPFLPLKVREGRTGDIRECIGCNMCVSRANIWGGRIVCTQNATIGEEFRRGWHPERYTRAANHENDVLVVGGGPAGMEAALTLARRGMRNVHLVDASPELGGCLNWMTQLPGRSEWRRIIEYRELKLAEQRDVQVITNTALSADDVLDYGAGIVVIATGSSYSLDGVTPQDRRSLDFLHSFGSNLLTPEAATAGAETIGKRVLVVDLDGYFVGPSLAEKLARAGHEVAISTQASTLGYYLTLTTEHTLQMADLAALGVDVLLSTAVVGAEAGEVAFHGAGRDWTREFDSVVLVGQRTAHHELFRELRSRRSEWADNGVRAVYQIGDCVRPGFIAEAIFSGHRLGREIDAPDPREPLPYVRERRLIRGTDADFELGAPASQPIH